MAESIAPIKKGLLKVEKINDEIIRETRADIDGELQARVIVVENTKANNLVKRDGKWEITQSLFEEQLKQLQVELADRLEGQKPINRKLARFEQLVNTKRDSLCFVIPQNISKAELKAFMEKAKARLEVKEDEKEKAYLEAILPALETHKNMIDAGKAFPDKLIPITEDEEQYHFLLLAELNNADPEFISSHVKRLKTLTTLRESVNNDAQYSAGERIVINTLFESLIKETKRVLITSTSPNANKDDIEQDYALQVKSHLQTASKLPGLKWLIDTIASLFGLGPIFQSEKTNSLVTSLNSRFFNESAHNVKTAPENNEQHEDDTNHTLRGA